jgi:hypothetical protein
MKLADSASLSSLLMSEYMFTDSKPGIILASSGVTDLLASTMSFWGAEPFSLLLQLSKEAARRADDKGKSICFIVGDIPSV